MVWFQTFNDVFWLSVGSMSCTAVGICVKAALKSKCTVCQLCCGLVRIERNIDAEIQEETNNNTINRNTTDNNDIELTLPPSPPTVRGRNNVNNNNIINL